MGHPEDFQGLSKHPDAVGATLLYTSQAEQHRNRCMWVLLRDGDVFCSIEDAVLLCYASTLEAAREKGLALVKLYSLPAEAEKPKFYVLSLESNVLHSQAVEVAKPIALNTDELQLHYGNDALEFERYLTGAWDSDTAGN